MKVVMVIIIHPVMIRLQRDILQRLRELISDEPFPTLYISGPNGSFWWNICSEDL